MQGNAAFRFQTHIDQDKAIFQTNDGPVDDISFKFFFYSNSLTQKSCEFS